MKKILVAGADGQLLEASCLISFSVTLELMIGIYCNT
jgi:hypothetical protein